jgi:dTMP kinase
MFISFEGLDYSGKTTQIQKLKSYFESKNESVLVVREPGGSQISESIRDVLLDNKNHAMFNETELLLYASSRAQLVREYILPSLEKYDHVIADRFFDSTTVYQGYGRKLDIEFINQLNKFATNNTEPEITFYIDIDVNTAYERRKSAGRSDDRIESAGREFFELIRNGYLEIAELIDRINVIDGTQSVDEIHIQIIEKL